VLLVGALQIGHGVFGSVVVVEAAAVLNFDEFHILFSGFRLLARRSSINTLLCLDSNFNRKMKLFLSYLRQLTDNLPGF